MLLKSHHHYCWNFFALNAHEEVCNYKQYKSFFLAVKVHLKNTILCIQIFKWLYRSIVDKYGEKTNFQGSGSFSVSVLLLNIWNFYFILFLIMLNTCWSTCALYTNFRIFVSFLFKILFLKVSRNKFRYLYPPFYIRFG